MLTFLASALDQLVYAVAPAAGARRIALRRQWNQLEKQPVRAPRNRAHEGAEENRTRAGRWLGSRLSPDSALEEDLDSLRARSRELVRNDTVGGAVDVRVNQVVGDGFRAQARIVSDEDNDFNPADVKRWNRQLEKGFAAWERRADLTRRRSFWQTHRLVERTIATDGEALVILSDIGHADTPIPLVLEVVDVDRLETPPDRYADANVRLGIEYKAGEIVAYHVRRSNPNDSKQTDPAHDRIAADRVLHIFEQWFPAQSRGLPWLCRTLNRIKDAKDLDEAAIIAAQVEACFAAFVRTDGNPSQTAIGSATSTENGRRLQEIQPGQIAYLGSEEDIEFANPSRSGAGYAPLQEMNCRRIAAGMNFPYEWLSRDWRGLSFAGGRLVLQDARLDARSRRRLLIEMFCEPVWQRVVEELVIVGAVAIDPRDFARRKPDYLAHTWTPPAWPYAINPGEEVRAEVEAIENNLKTKAEVIAEHGGDLEEVFAARTRERAMEREGDILPPLVAQTEANSQPAAVAAAEEADA